MWLRCLLAVCCMMVTLPDTAHSQSLFKGRSADSFFAPRKVVPVSPAVMRVPILGRADPVHRIRQLIGEAESRLHGYDAVQHGARRKPAKLPTQMTIAEIYHWIDATPGQPHAIGRYQFIPATLRRLVRQLGVDRDAMFSKQLQDRLADELLSEAGMAEFRAGEIGRHAFMNNLAKIWAGLPNTSGRSHYHGYAGNKASITWDRFDREMADIFPASS